MSFVPCSAPGCHKDILVSGNPREIAIARSDPDVFAIDFVKCEICSAHVCSTCVSDMRDAGVNVECPSCGRQLQAENREPRNQVNMQTSDKEQLFPGFEELVGHVLDENVFMKIHRLIAQNRFDEALICCDTALKTERSNATLWGLKGNIMSTLNKHIEAVSFFDKALSIQPEDSIFWFAKGFSLLQLNRNLEALDCLGRATRLDPLYALGWYHQGIALSRLNRKEEAAVCWDKTVETDPNNGDAWRNKGIYRAKHEKWREALDCFDKAVRLNSSDAEAWHNKGVSLYKLGMKQEAVDCFKEGAKLGFDMSVSTLNLLRERP